MSFMIRYGHPVRSSGMVIGMVNIDGYGMMVIDAGRYQAWEVGIMRSEDYDFIKAWIIACAIVLGIAAIAILLLVTL